MVLAINKEEKRRQGKKEYGQILFEVAHHVLIILGFLANLSSETGVPLQSLFNAILYYPTFTKMNHHFKRTLNCDSNLKVREEEGRGYLRCHSSLVESVT